MVKQILAICIGASAGAVLRWLLGKQFNPILPELPLGTLVANLIGAYFIGVAIVYFTHYPTLSPEWRLAIITGFLGALTTFSTFSAEVVSLMQQGRVAWSAGIISAHVIGSITLTVLGMLSMNYWRGLP